MTSLHPKEIFFLKLRCKFFSKSSLRLVKVFHDFEIDRTLPRLVNFAEGPLHSFDESDMETAQLALKANPDKKNEPQEATLQTKLALRRWFSATKRKLEQVSET